MTTATTSTNSGSAAPDLPKREQRRFRVTEVRDKNPDSYTLTGYASVFDNPYDVGYYEESVAAGAFKRTLAERADVRLLINHDGLPLARTKSGTMRLSEDNVGLLVEADLDKNDPDVAALWPKMQRGDLDEMSFQFQAMRQEWNDDYTKRTLLEVKLFDVSLVTFPANPATSAELRADLTEPQRRDWAIGLLANMRADDHPTLFGGQPLAGEHLATVLAAQAALNELLSSLPADEPDDPNLSYQAIAETLRLRSLPR